MRNKLSPNVHTYIPPIKNHAEYVIIPNLSKGATIYRSSSPLLLSCYIGLRGCQKGNKLMDYWNAKALLASAVLCVSLFMCMASPLPLEETTNLDQYPKNVVLLRQEKPFHYVQSCQRESVLISSICQDFYTKNASTHLHIRFLPNMQVWISTVLRYLRLSLLC